MPSRRQFLIGCLGAGMLATPAGWYATAYEPNDIEVVRRTVAIRNLPSKLNGLTAVQISDLHVRTIADVHLHMADMVRQLRPDLSGAWLHHGLSSKYTHGMYQLQDARMYVNRGIGTTTLPVRIGARPEITHFTFHG